MRQRAASAREVAGLCALDGVADDVAEVAACSADAGARSPAEEAEIVELRRRCGHFCRSILTTMLLVAIAVITVAVVISVVAVDDRRRRHR